MKTNDCFRQRDAEKLRGYFLKKYMNDSIFHNHQSNSKSMYRMPLIQYKILNQQPCVVGLSEGSRTIIEEFLKLSTLNIAGKDIKIESAELEYSEEQMCVDDSLHKYKFRTMWLPITQRNYENYKNGKLDLNIVLRNNILSNFKGFHIEANSTIMVSGDYRERVVYLKNTKMISFYGEFVSNAVLPELVGIGQRRAIGYGDVIRITSHK